jgi:hypothetical protein
MDKNVRVNQTELDRLQQEQEKMKNQSKGVLTKAGLKTTGLDDDDDDMRSTSTSESSSESSSSVDDDDDNNKEGYDFEQLWVTIRRDVVDKMEHHLKKKKPLPKLPPRKNDLPIGVYHAYSKYKSQIFSHRKTRYIGTWSKPEQAAKAYLFTQDALRDLKNKKTRNKEPKSLLKKKKKSRGEVDDGSRSLSGSDDNDGNVNDNDINSINNSARAYTADNDDDDPHMAHFDRIRQRTTILPCREREKELLMSFRIMQNEMQILFRRVSFFKTQLEDRQQRQIFKDEIKERIMKEEEYENNEENEGKMTE